MGITEQVFVGRYLAESTSVLQKFADDPSAQLTILAIAEVIAVALANGKKLLVAGNGGSAGDAQHIAGEFISRLFFDRNPLASVALTTDTSVLTAIGNDYGYDRVFERQVLGLGISGDVFLAISTSGKSPNIVRALEAAKAKHIVTVGFTGSTNCPMDYMCDHILHAPSSNTPIIQQIHIVAAHIVCGLVERKLCGEHAVSNT